jgi:hypothetical protein
LAWIPVVSDVAPVDIEAQATAAEATLADALLTRVAKVERELDEYKKLYALLRESASP